MLHVLAQLMFGIFCVAMFVIWCVGALFILEVIDDKIVEWRLARADKKIIKNATTFRGDFS